MALPNIGKRRVELIFGRLRPCVEGPIPNLRCLALVHNLFIKGQQQLRYDTDQMFFLSKDTTSVNAFESMELFLIQSC
jgi:hypothetical protein